jgi:hypothetical protein
MKTAYDILGETVVDEMSGVDFDVKQLINAGAEVANKVIDEVQKAKIKPGVPGAPATPVVQPPPPPPVQVAPPSTNFFTQQVAGIPVWGWGAAIAAIGTGVVLALRSRRR